jgi:hypothetical protein
MRDTAATDQGRRRRRGPPSVSLGVEVDALADRVFVRPIGIRAEVIHYSPATKLTLHQDDNLSL